MVTTTTSSDPNQICNHPGLNPDPHNPRDCGVYYSCKPAPNYPGKCFPVVEFQAENSADFAIKSQDNLYFSTYR